MDNHGSLVDVLLLPDCNLYQRYPELVQRVDYFLYDWCESMLARTEYFLRQQSRWPHASSETNNEKGKEDEATTHTRSRNIVWRQWAVNRLQLPQYPPERINWNKDADPVFLYGQVPALRLGVPWSVHSIDSHGTQTSSTREIQLKPALKRTDLQTFLTSPTLSPASSPLYSPLYSPAMSIRENMSTSSFGSDETLDNDEALKPRLRFNDRVEQCMVVFDQEKEYLPTDYEDMSEDENDVGRRLVTAKHTHRRTSSTSSRTRATRKRRSLVIKLAPTQLKDERRRLAAVAAETSRYDSDEDDPFGDYDDSFAMFGDLPASQSSSNRTGGVGSYVQGCVQSVAGQVRRLVGDTVLASSFTKEHADGTATNIVSDPYASSRHRHKPSSRNSSLYSPSTHASTATRETSDVVRDPFATSAPKRAPCDNIPFDDDEDAIIQEFEREMQRYSTSAPQQQTYSFGGQKPRDIAEPAASEWGVDDYDMYDSEYQLHMDENDMDYADYQDSRITHTSPLSSYRADSQSNVALVRERSATYSAASAGIVQQRNVRNESIIDRAEDTIVNTVDAVKWCASFISNYTIF
ncbi:protein phosphatase regulator [Coemansia brasiliensis]|uniref:Protein phosphatase regulator n=1 Tax=Coemansia brasiliensis TaxID=2650707 RepID=A0A9W8M236_9FUNG|nr:protein phosphatase regulator [Coemansia brasiliensis]